nr:T9SS type A sorting domain-containing protein [Saprospiraceae bacterium]
GESLAILPSPYVKTTTGTVHSTEITIHPNPSSNELIVNGIDAKSLGNVEIHAMDGRVFRTKISDKTIDISRLPPGVFYLQLPEKTLRFVKQ